MTETHVPAQAKPSTAETNRAVSVKFIVQAVGSMWITPRSAPNQSDPQSVTVVKLLDGPVNKLCMAGRKAP